MGFTFSRNPGSVASGLQIWILLLWLTGCTLALNFTAVKEPTLDLDKLGRVGLGGDFNSIAMYQFEEQNAPSYNADGTHSVIVELPNGQFASLARTNGVINDMCVFVLKDGTTAGLIVGGNFTQIGGVNATGVALIDPNTGKVVTLAGLTGTVNTLLCDRDIETVFVGGEFSGGNSTNAITWVGMVGWANMPFAGFNGPVQTIQKTNNGSIIFGGQFDSIGNSSMTVGGKGSMDSPKNNQVINLNTAQVTATVTSASAGFNDPKNVLCPQEGQDGTSGHTWLLQDGSVGMWSAQFAFTYVPSFIRLTNAHTPDGRGVKTFSFVSRPNNGIMNLTYTDPETKTKKFCDAYCPMSNDKNVPFEDFHFVDNIAMNAFDIHIWDFYGPGAGLSGVQVFSMDQMSFAVPSLNEPNDCASSKLDAPSQSTSTGTWSTVGNQRVDSSYLMGKFSGAALGQASVTFKADVKKSGNYVVNIHTPGCEWDQTCATRGNVRIQGFFTKDQKDPVELTLAQTNPENKYDPIYKGRVDASSSDFTPSIILTPVGGQDGTKTVVAQKVEFDPQGGSGGSSGSGSGTGSDGSSGSGSSSGGGSDGGLGGGVVNGIFEYDPNKIVLSDSDIPDNTFINSGAGLDDTAVINTIVVTKDTTFVAGEFKGNNGINNIYSVNDKGFVGLAKGGLNGAVTVMKQGNDNDDNTLFVAGKFTNTVSGSTSGLGHIAGYDIKGKKWFGLGAGVNGNVEHIVPLQMNFTNGLQWTYVISGGFTKILASNGHPEVTVENIAIWFPGNNTWLEWLEIPPIEMEGIMSAGAPAVNGQIPFFGGSFLAGIGGTAGAVSIFNNPVVIESLGIKVDKNATIVAKTKRDTAVLDDRGITCGTFYTRNSNNFTIIGGRFTTNGKGGKVSNLAIIDHKNDNAVTGMTGIDMDSGSEFRSLVIADDILWAGGAISGKVNNTDIGGIFGWDMRTNSLLGHQPGPLTGNDVAVYTITNKPSTDYVFVGGKFDSAAGNSCNGLCYFDASESSINWIRPGSGFSGTVYASDWVTKDLLLVSGDMRINSTTVYMATFDFTNLKWDVFGGATSANVPGPVKTFSAGRDDGSIVYAAGQKSDGTSFLLHYNGKKWTDIYGSGMDRNSNIRSIQVLNVKEKQKSNEYLQDDQALLVSGNLQMKNIPVNISAALFDGSKWEPFLLTTGGAKQSSSVGAFFSEFKPSFTKTSGHLAVGLVVLISLAIALGLIFLIVVLGVLASFLRKRREGYTPAPTKAPAPAATPDMQERLPPGEILSGIGPQGGRTGVGGAPMI